MKSIGNSREASKRQDEAEYWLVMLRSPNLTPEKEAKFFTWLERSQAHQSAYIKAEQTWERGSVMAEAQSRYQAPVTNNEPRISNFFNFDSWQYGLVAGVFFIALGIVGVWKYDVNASTTAFYQTSVGQQQEVLLSDGSTLVLNTNSKIRTVISRQQRQVYLEYGEVFFSVAKDAGRPFDVYTDAGLVRVLGTQFSVYDSGERTLVTVLEGSVAVDNQANQSGQPFEADVTLVKNQQVVVEEVSATSVPRVVDASAKLGWRSKSLVFRGDSLQKVVDQLNRYFDEHIIIDDPELAEKKVAAVIQVSDFDIMLSTLEQALGLEIKRDAESNTVYLLPGNTF